MNSMTDTQTLIGLLDRQTQPVCAQLTPNRILDADFQRGFIKLEFSEQPAFSNHFGNIQGGFAVAMVDVLISFAAYAKVRQWLPTVEIHSRFVAPAKLGICVGEGWVVKAGKTLVFLEAQLYGGDGQLAVHATAIASIKPA